MTLLGTSRKLMHSFHRHCIAILCSFVCASAAESDEHGDHLFETYIRPVLIGTCFRCHGDVKASGGLRVDSREAFITGGESGASILVGKPEESLLIKAIRRHEEVSAMPPDKEKALRPDQIAAFETWIRTGAHWPALFKKFQGPKHWSFEPINTGEPPKLKGAYSGLNSIDAFLFSKQTDAGAIPSIKADKRTLIRRATFDLTGLPPTPVEVAAFLKDTSLEAYEKVIDQLLHSSHYGERWGRHWLDVVRYADTAGETADHPVPLAWRYRNYVIDAFNSDKPYDQFLREQISGDVIADPELPEKYAEQVTATGYLAISRRFGFDSENYHHLTIQDTIDTLGQSVLGLSLGCARCHDHKFDAISRNDYYGLYAIFDSSRYSFPGSEQKQKFRSMVPLLPPREAVPKWRAFEERIASLRAKLEKAKMPGPSAVLRSLNGMDGDFEMQAPAAGGSTGVLVPPWLFQGKIAVTNTAQSPYKNVHASGNVGVSIAAEAGYYRISQSLYPRRTYKNCRTLHINLDFRVAASNSNTTGIHRFWIGDTITSPALLMTIESDSVSMQTDHGLERIAQFKPNEWQNLQLNIDLVGGNVSGDIGTALNHTSFSGKPLISQWTGTLDLVVFESSNGEQVAAPAIDFDNLDVREEIIPSAFTPITYPSSASWELDRAALTKELMELVAMEGDFELQEPNTGLSSPWNAGPNSVVKVANRSQSPFQNLYPIGQLGIHMPNRSEYDGFGLTLPKPWKSDQTERLFACFDFRCAEISAGGDGTWRYYVGHGPGNSAAVELFFNAKQFFRRSGDLREPVCELEAGKWYQVQLAIDLKTKSYTGVLNSDVSRKDFGGELASGWDETIDYSFIDSYGHIGGVRPSLDADNYVIRETAFPSTEKGPEPVDFSQYASRQERARTIKRQLATNQLEAQQALLELNSLLTDGPCPMAYGMAEGTPHGVAVHLRGEPGQSGELVPRGFIKVLGGSSLPEDLPGSGRLELAQWLTRPDNPLTARVMVNRIWQYHFGVGLVKTPNDFGVRGIPPTHPELLDYLATRFIESGWSIKAMHRLIMFSATYQQSSTIGIGSSVATTDIKTTDLCTHFLRRRLSAEEIRDSILAVCGELNREPAQAHPFPSPLQWGFTQHGPFQAVYEHNQRSVYLMTQRLKRHPYLALFDGPDPNATTADRLGTTVPTQALYFLNDSFVHASADAWAKRLLANNPPQAVQINQAYEGAFSRPATTAEQSDAADFLIDYRSELTILGKNDIENLALSAFLRTLLASNEFLHVD